MSLENVKLVVDILQGVAVIGASAAAVVGINAWKREHIGKRRIELAEEVLVHLYKAQDALERIRQPYFQPGEGSTRKGRSDETERERALYNTAFIIMERYNKNIETFKPIYALRYKFKAVFGPEDYKVFEQFESVFWTIRDAWIQRARLLKERDEFSEGSQDLSDWEVRWKANARIYEASGGDDDPIARQIVSVISKVEKICAREATRL